MEFKHNFAFVLIGHFYKTDVFDKLSFRIHQCNPDLFNQIMHCKKISFLWNCTWIDDMWWVTGFMLIGYLLMWQNFIQTEPQK